MPSIVIDARMLRFSGIGSYIRNLVPRVAEALPDIQFHLLGLREQMEAWEGVRLKNVAFADCRTPIYSVSEQVALAQAIPQECDLFWAPHYNIPLFFPGRLLVTVHDVFHLAQSPWAIGIHRYGYARLMFHQAARRSRAMLCVSQFTKSELMKRVRVEEGKIRVVHNGVDLFWSGREKIPVNRKPYLLFVGNVKPNKNLGRLLEAFGMVQNRIPHELLIVGKKEGFRTGDAGVLAQSEKFGDRVRFTGEVENRELRRLYQGAAALVFPSLYEGFGLPPLEAMASGCPVVVSNAASLPEVCGNAALYFDPLDPRGMAESILKVLSDRALRTRLQTRGKARVLQFTWEKAAERTCRVIRESLG